MATTKTKRSSAESLIGNPAEVARDLQGFQRSARILSSKRQHLIDRYPHRWVAVHNGKVRAQGKTLASLLAQADKKNLPRDEILVRFIERNRRTMIL